MSVLNHLNWFDWICFIPNIVTLVPFIGPLYMVISILAWVILFQIFIKGLCVGKWDMDQIKEVVEMPGGIIGLIPGFGFIYFMIRILYLSIFS